MTTKIEYHLPSALTSIGSNAYQGCSNLKSLNIQENLQTIGDNAFAGCYQISSIVDKILSAQTTSTNTFGLETGTSNTAYTGYQTKGSNVLYTYFDATGYDENSWKNTLQNPDKCGFIRQYLDPENIAFCNVTFDAGIGYFKPKNNTISHIKFIIDKIQSGAVLQISRFELIKSDGTYLNWSNSTTIECNQINIPSNETPDKLLDHSVDTKCCPNNITTPITFIINLDESNRFNVNDIQSWQWWTANDTASYSGRNPKSFKLQFSADGTNYITVDEVTNYSAPAQNKVLGYEGTIKNKEQFPNNEDEPITSITRTIIQNKKLGSLPIPTVTGEQAYFGGWSPVADDVDSIIDEDYKVTSDMTLYAVYSSQPFANYEVILNNQWQASSKTNPDTSKYDGVYESFSNYNQGSKAAVMYIKIKGYSKFTIYIRSYAESSYDYTVAFNLDTYTPSTPLMTNPSSSTSGVKAHTSGKQNSGTAIGSYTKVEYTGIDSKEHYICVAYRKDSSVNSGDDRGYILVEKQGSGTFEPVKYINVNFEIGEGTLVSGETTTVDVQGSTLSRIPEISAPTSKPYFIGWNTQADGSGEYYDNTTILPNQESLTLYAYYVAEDPIDPNKDIYLCFTAEQANSTIQLSAVGTAPTVYLETSRTCNNVLEGWSDFIVGSTTITLENIGDKIYFRAKQDNNVFATSSSNYNKFVMTGKIAASGNLNTLLKADGSVVDLTGRNYCYTRMFQDCTSLTSAPELPATTLAGYCYYGMFFNCTSLTQAPVLPATTLTSYCYIGMFNGCTSLISAPELPATTLADWCYNTMFQNCTSLTQAPELPATTLASYCYRYMFKDCTSLTQAPALPATKLINRCYDNMFSGCTSLTQAPALPAMTLNEYCYHYMFQDCTSLTSAPELPATTLASYCYFYMFSGCTALTQAPALPATTLARYCYFSMFYNCTSLTQAPALPATKLANDCYYYMFNGCTSLTSAPELPATTLAERCYYSMFKGCTSLTQAPELPSTKLANDCYYYMFEGCTALTQAPALPATTLEQYCYSSMFRGCTSLTDAPALPATTLDDSCYSSMFSGCTSLISAPELPATSLANDCYYYMFSNCTKLNNINVNFSAWNPSSATIGWVTNVSSSGTFTCPVDLPETYGTAYIPANWEIVRK